MDRNSAIGLTLIAVLLLVYFNFLAPQPVPEVAQPAQVTSPISKGESDVDSLMQSAQLDSTILQQYGALSSFLSGNEETTIIENSDLKITLSNNGYPKEIQLKNFKTYSQQPLFLAKDGNNTFSLVADYEGKQIDLYKLFYQSTTSKKGDTTVITLSANTGDRSFIKHIYSIPPSGFLIGYDIQTSGISLRGKNLTYRWHNLIALQEKSMADSRTKTTINYYVNDEFDGLSETSTDLESDALSSPVKWVAMRQKFFISSIIAKNSFAGGEVKTVADLNDSSVVKEADVELLIATEDLASKKSSFQYYFGPSDYDILPNVTEGFSKNLSLGWPPMLWITKYVLIPVFKFLERFFSNYGIIIMLLVLFVKLVLLPLSYKSYLGMAKMKLLKPELDLIKEKNGDNMAQNQQDQMKLYQQAGVNPFSGCIPLLLQMPILFAMFWFFPVAIQLRQQPFLWAEDLSAYDSIATLPFTIPFYGDHVSLFVILMTGASLLSVWQNNQLSTVQGPMKSMQYIMPVVFMFILNSFSAGLSFYYFFSTMVTFAQQAIIKRFVDEDKIMAVMEDHKKKMLSGGGTGKKSNFMSKLEQAMKASEEARKASKKK